MPNSSPQCHTVRRRSLWIWKVIKMSPLAIEGHLERNFYGSFLLTWQYQKPSDCMPKRTQTAVNNTATWLQTCSLPDSKTKSNCFQISQSIKDVIGIRTPTVEPCQPALLHPLSPGTLTQCYGSSPLASTLSFPSVFTHRSEGSCLRANISAVILILFLRTVKKKYFLVPMSLSGR